MSNSGDKIVKNAKTYPKDLIGGKVFRSKKLSWWSQKGIKNEYFC